ncbi:DUF2637 domain-containing protein [Nocardia sp. CA-084685]|uniref:DUF2637 domain-containing protein n=1 Tax=Nocardia sp. CA-084685 TaxID=3239970 RepID=UPI003D964F82
MTDTATISPTTEVPSARPELTTRKPRAHAFFWTVLAAAATVSITGNATQALLHNTALPAVAAAVAIIPPLALLAAVHGVSVLLRAHAGARGTHLIATAMTVLIATGAFWLSFTALRSLAITAGVPHSEAWLWPLIIEGSMAQSTVALLALAHSTHGSEHPHDADHEADDSPSHHTERPIAENIAQTAQAVPNAVRDVHTPVHASVDARQDFSDLAERLCARDPARRRDPALVAQALTHRHRDGWNPTRIANELNKSRSTISRIFSDAAAFSTHDAISETTVTSDHRGGSSPSLVPPNEFIASA